jgi:4-diphosphocytidyl-2C-methyl-D-erythritol kinase
MSGSGPTVFGVFEDVGAARAARAGLRDEPGLWIRVAADLGAPGSGPG